MTAAGRRSGRQTTARSMRPASDWPRLSSWASTTRVAITHAVRFLAVRQQADGSWEEDAVAAAGAPRWVKPGDVEARLYLTANCGFWLTICGEHDDATKAAAYLQARPDENGHMPSFPHTHWLAAGLWYRLNWQEPAERIAPTSRAATHRTDSQQPRLAHHHVARC